MLDSEIRNIRKQENLHILLWLIKDTFWVLNFQVGGMIMILPTLVVAIAITWRWRHLRSELFHNIAVCFWISANVSWMIGEFFFNDSIRPIAVMFFSLGLFSIAYYYFSEFFWKKKEV
jgi:hypothetical protein